MSDVNGKKNSLVYLQPFYNPCRNSVVYLQPFKSKIIPKLNVYFKKFNAFQASSSISCSQNTIHLLGLFHIPSPPYNFFNSSLLLVLFPVHTPNFSHKSFCFIYIIVLSDSHYQSVTNFLRRRIVIY